MRSATRSGLERATSTYRLHAVLSRTTRACFSPQLELSCPYAAMRGAMARLGTTWDEHQVLVRVMSALGLGLSIVNSLSRRRGLKPVRGWLLGALGLDASWRLSKGPTETGRKGSQSCAEGDKMCQVDLTLEPGSTFGGWCLIKGWR
jgi:hypothetical protein